jgi:hypothetical protein
MRSCHCPILSKGQRELVISEGYGECFGERIMPKTIAWKQGSTRKKDCEIDPEAGERAAYLAWAKAVPASFRSVIAEDVCKQTVVVRLKKPPKTGA